MATQAIDGALKAAVLVLHLDEEVSSAIFQSLSRAEIRRLTQAASEIATLKAEDIDAVLEEFREEMQGAELILKAGADTVAHLVNESLGPERAKDFLSNDGEITLGEILMEADERTLSSLMKKEHPQTVALVLAHLEPQRAAELVVDLPDGTRSDVLRRLAKIDQVTPDMVRLVAESLRDQIDASASSAGSRQVGGVKVVADILNNVEHGADEELMQQLEELDAELAEEVRSRMFVYEDLARLDDKAIQALLKELSREVLVLSLKAAPDAVKAKIFGNLSSRAIKMIEEDLEARGPVRLREVEQAQSEVVREVLALATAGTIEISMGNDDAYV